MHKELLSSYTNAQQTADIPPQVYSLTYDET